MESVFDYLNNLLKDSDVIVLGNSGGPDSMALLSLLIKIRKNKNIKIISAHINHNVRKESKAEQEFLEEYCINNSIPFEFMKIEKLTDDNFESQARKIRYNFFEKIIVKYNANYLMTAHHGDDLMETILMRMTRGSSLKGYSGFKQVIEKETYKIIRPLITLTKKEIEEYDIKENIPYVIDKSNFTEIHTRNRYRKTVLPFLKSEDKDVHKKFLKFSLTLQKYDEYINGTIKKTQEKLYKNNIMDISKYKKLEPLIQEKTLDYIMENIYQDDLMLINDSHVGLIKELIHSNKTNSYVCLPNNIKVIKSYNNLIFTKESNNIDSYKTELIDYIKLPNGKEIKKIKETESNDNNICRILSSEVKIPLYVRTRNYGDKMELKKLNGSKKIKDIFIDSKIDLNKRDIWPILVDSNDRIIWIPGIKKSKYTKTKTEKYDIIYKYID